MKTSENQGQVSAGDLYVRIPTQELDKIWASDEEEFFVTAAGEDVTRFDPQLSDMYKGLETQGLFFRIIAINQEGSDQLKLKIVHGP